MYNEKAQLLEDIEMLDAALEKGDKKLEALYLAKKEAKLERIAYLDTMPTPEEAADEAASLRAENERLKAQLAAKEESPETVPEAPAEDPLETKPEDSTPEVQGEPVSSEQSTDVNTTDPEAPAESTLVDAGIPAEYSDQGTL